MASLLDIAPLTATVRVRGLDVAVTGVPVCEIAALLSRFPVLAQVLTGREVTVSALLSAAPEAIADIIATGTGMAGQPEAIAMARSLLPEEVVDVLEAILRMTMPRGVGPLVERLAAMGSDLGVAASPTAPATTLPQE